MSNFVMMVDILTLIRAVNHGDIYHCVCHSAKNSLFLLTARDAEFPFGDFWSKMHGIAMNKTYVIQYSQYCYHHVVKECKYSTDLHIAAFSFVFD
jgi:hypothetical protein